MYLLLWILAAALIICGVLAIIRGAILWGIVLIIIGLLVGPGGVSLFTDNDNDDNLAPTTHTELQL